MAGHLPVPKMLFSSPWSVVEAMKLRAAGPPQIIFRRTPTAGNVATERHGSFLGWNIEGEALTLTFMGGSWNATIENAFLNRGK